MANGLIRSRIQTVHVNKLYGFMTYLETATEIKGLEVGRENWAGFYARLRKEIMPTTLSV